MKKRQEYESLFEKKEIIHVIEDLLSLLGPVKYSLTLVLLVFSGFFLCCLGKFLSLLVDDFYPVAVAMALFSIWFIIATFL